MNWTQQTKLFLRKARGDLYSAKVLAERADTPDENIGFCIQQAVEKSLKALLNHHQIQAPRTHDLTRLAELAAALDPAPPLDPELLMQAQPFAVAWRYDDEPQSIDRQALIVAAEALLDWVIAACTVHARPDDNRHGAAEPPGQS